MELTETLVSFACIAFIVGYFYYLQRGKDDDIE